MKINKIYRLVSIVIIAFVLHSCVKDGNFKVPEVSIKEPMIKANSTINAIQSALIQEYKTNNKLTYNFREGQNLWASGYVVSSDKTGNFYRKLIIQDKPENPTAGVEISIDKAALSETFDVGRKVYILLDGLSVSYDDGERTIDPTNTIGGKFILGKNNGKSNLDRISAAIYTNHIKRSAEVAKIIPTKIAIQDFSQKNINTFVELTAMQFQKSEIGKTFSGEATDQFEGLRILTDGNADIPLQTSTFSSFKSNVIPEKRGNIVVVLTKDFRAKNYVVVVNTPSDINFSEDRFDPIFSEDFSSATNRQKINFPGWTNFAEKGRRFWNGKTYRGNTYAEFSSYRSRDIENVGWLISPAINMNVTKNEVLTFKTAQNYVDSDANKIEVFISTDYDGSNVTAATWNKISPRVAKRTDRPNDFINSGPIDISSYTGTLYVAFKVTGGKGSAIDGSFRVDDFKISGASK